MNQLLPEEMEIENNIVNLKPISKEKRNKIKGLIDSAKKNKAISLRITNYDLKKLKEKAGKEGIPYQTLINSSLHKYITNQLLEKEEIIKTISVIQKMKV